MEDTKHNVSSVSPAEWSNEGTGGSGEGEAHTKREIFLRVFMCVCGLAVNQSMLGATYAVSSSSLLLRSTCWHWVINVAALRGRQCM